ncbi:MAG: hypothetical protein JNK23_15715 [Opitutaceae bacterium]|nr:hypothetical protein [Opitutaceae bacterium]
MPAKRLIRHLPGHDVRTVPHAGWASIKNGKLLALAEGQFDDFLTIDGNLTYQQHLPDYMIAVLVVSAPSNRLGDLLPLVPAILAALPGCKPGLATRVAL